MPGQFVVGTFRASTHARSRDDFPRAPKTKRRTNASTAVLSLLVLVLGGSVGAAAAPGENGSASRETRETAIRSIPYDVLDDRSKSLVADVVNHVSVFRRLPTQAVNCDPSLYWFLVDNPDAVVGIWHLLGVSDVTLERAADGRFQVSDGAGTLGVVEYLYRDESTHVLYAEGSYEGPLFARPVEGKCLLVLHSGFSRDANGRPYVTCQLDTFVKLERRGIALLAKTFQPLVGHVADQNFHESVAFLALLSRAAEVNPEGTQRVVAKLDTIDPEARGRLSTIFRRVYFEAAVASRNQPRGDPSDGELVAPNWRTSPR